MALEGTGRQTIQHPGRPPRDQVFIISSPMVYLTEATKNPCVDPTRRRNETQDEGSHCLKDKKKKITKI